MTPPSPEHDGIAVPEGGVPPPAPPEAIATALTARGARTPWWDLAAPLGITDDSGETHPAYAAFQMCAGLFGASPPRPPFEPTVTWRCASCQHEVTDHGPYAVNPADRETGHAVDCARQRAEIAAYEKDIAGEDTSATTTRPCNDDATLQRRRGREAAGGRDMRRRDRRRPVERDQRDVGPLTPPDTATHHHN